MGSVANYPLALATGLGLNTFVAVGIASQMSWAAAMGLVVLEGLIILVLVLTGFRVAVFKAVPAQIKIAISVGIGLFIALIGLVDAGFVRRTASGPVPVGLGVNGNLVGWPTVVFVFGTLLIIALMVRKVKGAILIGIVGATVAAVIIQKIYNIAPGFTAGNPPTIVDGGWGLNIPTVPTDIVSVPKFDFTGQFDLLGAFSVDNVSLIAAILLLFTLLLSDFFDTVGTFTAIGHEAVLADKY
jgi:AGZA family xanthine/uracil permease-like MFS transporter